MKNFTMQRCIAIGATVVASALPAFAVVDAPDTTSTVTYLETNGPTVIAAIGGVMLTLAGVAVLFKWAKASVFG